LQEIAAGPREVSLAGVFPGLFRAIGPAPRATARTNPANLRRFAGYDPQKIREFQAPEPEESYDSGTLTA
jgi:hypothetical protein